MSDGQPPTEPVRDEGLGCTLIAFLIGVGLLLMLPGLCATIAIAQYGAGGGLGIALILTLPIAVGGIWLISWVVGKR